MSCNHISKLPARQTLLCASILFLVQTSVAGANDIIIPSGDTVTKTQTIDEDGDTLIVEDGGRIDTFSGSGANGAAALADDQTVINNGTISAPVGILSTGIGTTNTNNGEINAVYNGVRSIGDNTTNTNNGTIVADQVGLYSMGVNATNTNNGTIDAGYGLWSTGNNSMNTNNGMIDAENGIVSYGNNVTNTNNGSINAFHGIYSTGDNAANTNNGTINAFRGIFSIGDNAAITNSGKIFASRSAFFMGGDNSTLNLLAGSVFEGPVYFNGDNATLHIGNGLNLYIDYDGTIETLDSDVPFVHDETDKIVYTVDPTGFALAGSFIQTTADAVHGAVRSGAGFGNSFGGGFSGSSTFGYGADGPGFAEAGPRGWASTFGGYQKQNGSGSVTGGSQAYSGVVTGGGFTSQERLYGVFAGGSYSRLETDHDTQQIDATSVYGGLYGGMALGVHWISVSVMGGHASFNSERTVANNWVDGGLETASADYDGTFISPSLTIGRSFGDRIEFSVGGHYAGLFLGGYTESGSAANLTVGSRDVHVAAASAQVKYLAQQHRTAQGLVSLETWAGVDGFFNLGGDEVDAVLAGTAFNFDASFSDAAAIGFAGIGINHRPDDSSWSFNASLEGRYGSDAYSDIRATAAASIRF